MAAKVTLKEVAARAGVSYQTVSKVINKQVQVSKETEERIWQAVRELDYRPNVIARSLRSQRSHMIGYSWEPAPPGELNPILDQFLGSMVAAAESAGYHLLTFPHRSGHEWIAAYKDLMDTGRVDGFVLSSVDYNDARIQLLQEQKFPFVAFGRSNAELPFPFVDVDGGFGMRLVVSHLIQQGHRRIAALAWPEASRVGQNRMEGVVAAMKAAGLSLSDEFLLRGEGNYMFGYEGANRLLSLPPEQRPTAIVAFNDLMAIGAMHAVQVRGLQVGNDIAVTGFDDIPTAQYLTPPLTTVRQPIWEIGQKVVSILLQALDGDLPEPPGVLVNPRLVVRGSSACCVQA